MCYFLNLFTDFTIFCVRVCVWTFYSRKKIQSLTLSVVFDRKINLNGTLKC